MTPADQLAPTPHNLEAERVARLAPRPSTVSQTGLSLSFLSDLVSKHLASAGVLRVSEIAERMALSGSIIDQILYILRAEGRAEVRARLGEGNDLRYGLTERGRADALDALVRSGYVGPAPVPLERYKALVRLQSVHSRKVTRAFMRESFRNVTISDVLLDQLGPALNSGRAIFIYGAAGTGKTFIAKRLADALPGIVLVPHALLVNDSVVEVFNPLAHCQIELAGAASPLMLEQGFDRRFVCCERPMVLSGGELTAEMLEVHQDTDARRFHAPVQLKANCGFLLIDDLGRQRISPKTLFNRWIVPLEEGIDHLTVAGQHFTVPFDVVLIFSTNLNPNELADDAFLRRLGYKIAFHPVTPSQYRQIWDLVCNEEGIVCEPGVLDYVFDELYTRSGTPLLPCHPRDLLGMARQRATYLESQDALSKESLLSAWNNYFVASGEASPG